MSAIAETLIDRPAPAGVATPWQSVAAVSELTQLESEWRALEGEGLATPYQSYRWLDAFAATVGQSHGLVLRFVAVRDALGQPIALLPLTVERRMGVRVASFLGGKHANYHMGVFRPDFAAALDHAQLRRLAAEIGAALGGVDALAFVNQPTAWAGVANPFALLATGSSPSAAYRLALVPGDGETTLRRSLSSHALKKIRHKRRRLAGLGTVSSSQAEGAAEIETAVSAFFAQKAQRFAGMGVADPFADPAVKTFLRRGLSKDASGQASLELHQLLFDGQPIAIFIGAVHGGRFSGMATSFSGAGEVIRCSPGEILLADLILAKAQQGFTSFDLGIGEARYKTTFCDARDDLVDSLVPLSAKGLAYARLAGAQRHLKRCIKGSPLLTRLVQIVRRGLARSLPPGGDG